MKRVLFLAYLFPPILNSGTQRPLKFAKYLSDYGWAPTVLTAAHFDGHPTDPELLAEIPEDVQVVRVPMRNERIAARLRDTLGTVIGGRLGDALSWRLRNRFNSPDLYALWRPEVTRVALQIFRETGFDAIYATGFPWTSLMAGRDIARATGRPLIADFRDPWAGEHLFREGVSRDVDLAMERQVVDDAHTVLTTTVSVARLLSNTHWHLDPDKFVSIYNGFDPVDLPAPKPRRADQPFRIVYTGVWKRGYDQSELYDSIEWLKRSQPAVLDGVEVVCAGFAPGEAARRGLQSIIKEVGVVSHSAAVELMQSADVLFVSCTDPQRQWAVPGKLYEYLATGRPVLALTYPDKEAGRVIQDVGGGVALSPEDPGTLYRALGEICRTRRFDVPPRNPQALARFERRQLTARLAAILDDACYTARSTRADSSAPSPTRSSYAGASSAQPATRVVS